jgi:hypothetical protein
MSGASRRLTWCLSVLTAGALSLLAVAIAVVAVAVPDWIFKW